MQDAIRKIARIISRTVADYVAPYYVHDCHGTYVACWSLATARSWLPACSARACITARYKGGEIVESRQQGVRVVRLQMMRLEAA